jgi:hypothetical protein
MPISAVFSTVVTSSALAGIAIISMTDRYCAWRRSFSTAFLAR